MTLVSTLRHRIGKRPVLFLALLILALLVRVDTAVLSEAGARKDALNNLELAHGLATTGQIVELDGFPSMYREPLPVALYAMQMRIDPRLDGVQVADLEAGGIEVRALRQQHLILIALLLAGVAAQAWRLAPARSRLASAAAAVLLVHAMLVEVIADWTLTELHASVAVIGAGLAAQRWVVQKRVHDAVLLGLVAGLGALTKSSLMYVAGTFIFALALLMLLRERSAARRIVTTALLAATVMGAVVLPWMARNAELFGTWSIADRGGISLWYRAVYEDASPAELRGSWYEFTPLPLRPIAGSVLGVTDADLDGPLRRVNRFHPDEKQEQRSFYELARIDRSDLTDAYFEAGGLTNAEARVLADQDLLRNGLDVLRRDPGRFILTAPMFLWRGTWVVKAAPLLPRPVLGLLNPLGMLALLAAAMSAVGGRRPMRFAVVGLPFGIVAFSSLLTIYEPRFSEPALPTMLLLLTVAIARGAEWIRGRRSVRA